MTLKLKYWLGALRPKTLPLSLAGVLSGNILAAGRGGGSWRVALLSVLTACFLQIASNLANDIADFTSGLDNSRSLGRFHALAEGTLGLSEYKIALCAALTASAVFGLMLILTAFGTLVEWQSLAMLTLGALALTASAGYSLGRLAYGPRGLGGFAVFFFFGFAGVCGSFYLQAKYCPADCWVLGAVTGLLSWGVLNINDIRDMDNDSRHGKKSLAVRLGKRGALIFQGFLLFSAWLLLALFAAINGGGWRYLVPVAFLPVFVKNLRSLASFPPQKLDPLLGELSLAAFSASVISACAAAYI